MNLLASKWRSLTALLIFSGMLGHVFVPQGFMPAGPGEGVPIKFCPAAVGGSHHDSPATAEHGAGHGTGHEAGHGGGHGDHHEDSEEPADHDRSAPDSAFCPVGSALAWGAAPAEAAVLQAAVLTLEGHLAADSADLFSSSLDDRPRPRGPPSPFFRPA